MNDLSRPGLAHKEYLRHIDGIRALAVLPVVLFHIVESLCPGGFEMVLAHCRKVVIGQEERSCLNGVA